MYHNEQPVGHAIAAYIGGSTRGLSRQDVHFTSKLVSNSTDYDAVRRSVRRSVDESGLGYIDLFLHSPYGGREARLVSWRALADAVEEGEVRTAGVSNWGEKHVSSGRIVISLKAFTAALSQDLIFLPSVFMLVSPVVACLAFLQSMSPLNALPFHKIILY